MNKLTNKDTTQVNKNNKTKPKNLIKKEYLESYNKLMQSIVENQKKWEKEQGDVKS